MTNFEYVSLIGHYNKLTLNRQVDPRLLSRGYTAEQLEKMKSSMSKLPSEIISLNVQFKCNLDDFNVNYLDFALVTFEAYNKNGVLPYPGSLSEQPNKIIEIFNVLDSLKAEREQRAYEEQQREQQKAQRKRK